MEREKYAIVVAGGSGTRMGGELPKQFMLLGGQPVLQRTLETFASAIEGIRLIVVLPKVHISTWKELCVRHDFSLAHRIAEGGITRFHSVRNALDKVPDGAVVMIHDGVRPFVSPELIRSMAKRAEEESTALIPVLPVTDTLRPSDPSSGEVVDRSRFVAVQTPQVFLSEDIKAAYGMPYDTRYTDDASVAAAHGVPLAYVAGERFNIKITTPEDLLFAGAILRRSQL